MKSSRLPDGRDVLGNIQEIVNVGQGTLVIVRPNEAEDFKARFPLHYRDATEYDNDLPVFIFPSVRDHTIQS